MMRDALMNNTINKPKLSILGCRGIPAKYGGFETFAERLALYLTDRGWQVTVYCEDNHSQKQEIFEEFWQNIRLVHIPLAGTGAFWSILFDWKSTLHAARENNLILTLGYNTAVFSAWYRLKGVTNLMNMDGLEWRRRKWKLPEKIWLYVNDRAGAWLANHLIADHPGIKKYLSNVVSPDKITMIPYGTEPVGQPDVSLLQPYNLSPNEYSIVIARAEPENHIEEIVSAFSSKKRGHKLIVLGRYLPEKFPYHRQVRKLASEEVIFPGAIYEKPVVDALRFYARLYLHGHSVGGTNPSLVEALAAGSPVLAHDNRFNRWVAGTGAHYFQDREDCAEQFDLLLDNADELSKMKQASLSRYEEEFSHNKDLKAYEALLTKYVTDAPFENVPVHSSTPTESASGNLAFKSQPLKGNLPPSSGVDQRIL
jgi:glycosyltransferase involved in cell wall biosynthesis